MNIINKMFPFTLQGFFFFCLSAVILITGFMRADLAALVWGCGFFLLVMYVFAGSHLFNIFLGKYLVRHPQAVNLFFSDGGICLGTTASAHITINLSSFFIPGFRLKLLIALEWHTREPIRIATFLGPGMNNLEILFTAAHRGKFSVTAIDLIISDFFGFTAKHRFVPVLEYINVYPDLISRDDLVFRITGDESTDIQKKRMSTDELLEVKKYYPGDDIRRINWKIFAHSGELFVRKGEETPPPDSKFLFILDPTETPFVPLKLRDDYLDQLIEIVCSIMVMILESGNLLSLSIPGESSVYSYSGKQMKNLLALLSGIWWIPEQTKIALPPKRKMYALVFSSPGSLSLPHILKALNAQDFQASVFLKNFLFPYAPARIFNLMRLFFISDKNEKNRKVVRSDILIFKQAMLAELDRYKKSPWRIQDVREI